MIKIDRSVPAHEQAWRNNLVVVSSPPTRFVGLVSDEEYAKALNGQAFVLTQALTYLANMNVQMRSPGAYSLVMAPHDITPFDLVADLNSVVIGSYQHIIRVADQPPAFVEWMTDRYLNHFDPPRVITADTAILGG